MLTLDLRLETLTGNIKNPNYPVFFLKQILQVRLI